MWRLRRFVRRLTDFARPGRADAELSREIASHLALLEEEFQRRGMSAEEARVAARRAFGGVEQAKEIQRDARSFPWLDDARRDLRHAVAAAPAHSPLRADRRPVARHRYRRDDDDLHRGQRAFVARAGRRGGPRSSGRHLQCRGRQSVRGSSRALLGLSRPPSTCFDPRGRLRLPTGDSADQPEDLRRRGAGVLERRHAELLRRAGRIGGRRAPLRRDRR